MATDLALKNDIKKLNKIDEEYLQYIGDQLEKVEAAGIVQFETFQADIRTIETNYENVFSIFFLNHLICNDDFYDFVANKKVIVQEQERKMLRAYNNEGGYVDKKLGGNELTFFYLATWIEVGGDELNKFFKYDCELFIRFLRCIVNAKKLLKEWAISPGNKLEEVLIRQGQSITFILPHNILPEGNFTRDNQANFVKQRIIEWGKRIQSGWGYMNILDDDDDEMQGKVDKLLTKIVNDDEEMTGEDDDTDDTDISTRNKRRRRRRRRRRRKGNGKRKGKKGKKKRRRRRRRRMKKKKKTTTTTTTTTTTSMKPISEKSVPQVGGFKLNGGANLEESEEKKRMNDIIDKWEEGKDTDDKIAKDMVDLMKNKYVEKVQTEMVEDSQDPEQEGEGGRENCPWWVNLSKGKVFEGEWIFKMCKLFIIINQLIEFFNIEGMDGDNFKNIKYRNVKLNLTKEENTEDEENSENPCVLEELFCSLPGSLDFWDDDDDGDDGDEEGDDDDDDDGDDDDDDDDDDDEADDDEEEEEKGGGGVKKNSLLTLILSKINNKDHYDEGPPDIFFNDLFEYNQKCEDDDDDEPYGFDCWFTPDWVGKRLGYYPPAASLGGGKMSLYKKNRHIHKKKTKYMKIGKKTRRLKKKTRKTKKSKKGKRSRGKRSRGKRSRGKRSRGKRSRVKRMRMRSRGRKRH